MSLPLATASSTDSTKLAWVLKKKNTVIFLKSFNSYVLKLSVYTILSNILNVYSYNYKFLSIYSFHDARELPLKFKITNKKWSALDLKVSNDLIISVTQLDKQNHLERAHFPYHYMHLP